MKSLFDEVSFICSKSVTRHYSTSFSMAVNMLSPSIRSAIHSIYGFVRCADEIVDSFHDWNREYLLGDFEKNLKRALKDGISLNPILNAFQHTVKKYHIEWELIEAFLRSMKMDIEKTKYESREEYEEYIYGSADVVGLMCLKVFVNGDQQKYEELKESAMRLGSAFQKVNFLRDLKNDVEILNRSYFPHIDLNRLDSQAKQTIIQEIEEDFKKAYKGIIHLPATSKFGVYTAYVYYRHLLKKLKRTPSSKIMGIRIRIRNHFKIILLIKSYFDVKMNII